VSDEPPPPRRLDPDAAAGAPRAQPAPAPDRSRPSSTFDTRRYRWAIGIFGLTIVIVLSIVEFAQNGVGSPGVTAGHALHRFVAPLATAGLEGDVNIHPRCDPADPNPRALNVCNRAPIVLAFFTTGSSSCEQQVDALQTLARRHTPAGVTYAAVAVHSGRTATLKAVRRHHWTIPVAYDRDGSLGSVYGVEICPLLEITRSNGIVARRLIGDHWVGATALAGQVRAALG
jgi:peroxiredoxin